MSPLRSIFRRARLFRAREKGNASIEFVLIFPAFMILFVSAFEAGLMMTRHVMLERATDITVRGLRLGTWTPPTHEQMKKSICNVAGIIPHCMENLRLELRKVSKVTWQPLDRGASCVDRSVPFNPLDTSFEALVKPGGENELMIVRVCAIVDPIFPATGLGLQLPRDHKGGYALVSTSAFVNEPK